MSEHLREDMEAALIEVVREHNETYGQDLKSKTTSFALDIISFYTSLPNNRVAQHLGHQAMRSGTSVGAHYREGQRARSTAEFISKFEVALQELAETDYWLELLLESGTSADPTIKRLRTTASELNRIFTASVRTAKRRKS